MQSPKRVMRIFMLLGLLATSVLTMQGIQAAEKELYQGYPYYYDGRFHNLDNDGHAGLKELLEWKLKLRKSTSQYHVTPLKKVPTAIPTLAPFKTSSSKVHVTWLGHATALIRLDEVTIITDPVFDNLITIKRRTPSPWQVQDLPKIDIVLLSHNHRDHLELSTLKALHKRFPKAVFIAPMGLGRWLQKRGIKNAQDCGWWQATTVGALQIIGTPARHWSRYGIADENRTHWSGWYLKGSKSVYYGGDSAYFRGFSMIQSRLGAPHVALIPIGAYQPRWMMSRQHMDPYEAIKAFAEVKAAHMIPVHWGAYKLADEPLGEPPVVAKQAARALGLERQLHVLPIGGQIEL